MKILLREEEAIRERVLNPRPPRRTFLEACEGYLTFAPRSEETVRRVRMIMTVASKGLLCERVNQSFLSDARRLLCRTTSGDPTYKRQVVAPTKAILTWAAAVWGAAEGCPKPEMLRVRDGRPRALIVQPHQAKALVEEALRRGWSSFVEILEVGICEGLRLSEFFALEWSEIDLGDGYMKLVGTKAKPGEHRDREILDLRPRSISTLERIQDRAGGTSGPVFLDDKGEPFSRKASLGRLMNLRLKALCDHLSFRRIFTLHHLRHTAASWHYACAKDMERVRVRMDWRTVASAARYVTLLPEGLEQEVADFWKSGSGLSRSIPSPEDLTPTL